VTDWFAYHASEEDFEASDQAALEQFWTKLHAALPELGGDIEIIETANPRTLLRSNAPQAGDGNGLPIREIPSHRNPPPNLFVVGDTVSPRPTCRPSPQQPCASPTSSDKTVDTRRLSSV
jgi:phytoene dehydrogenase-like protein